MADAAEPDPILTREFLQLARKGDAEAEWRLFSRYSVILRDEARRHRLMRFISNMATPDDIVSEVWVRGYASGSLQAFEDRGRGSLRRFLCVLLDRTMVDLTRRFGAVKRRSLLACRGFEVDSGTKANCSVTKVADVKEPTPTSNVRADELLRLCEEVLEEKEWRIWKLAESDGLDSAEIGVRLGISSSAVRGVLFRARAKLITALESRLDES